MKQLTNPPNEKSIRIQEIEIILRYIQERKASYIRRQRFEISATWRYEERKLLAELEKLNTNDVINPKTDDTN